MRKVIEKLFKKRGIQIDDKTDKKVAVIDYLVAGGKVRKGVLADLLIYEFKMTKGEIRDLLNHLNGKKVIRYSVEGLGHFCELEPKFYAELKIELGKEKFDNFKKSVDEKYGKTIADLKEFWTGVREESEDLLGELSKKAGSFLGNLGSKLEEFGNKKKK